jgi:beta-lactamase class A
MKLLYFLFPFLFFAKTPTKEMTLEQYFKDLDPEIQVSMVLQNQMGEILFERNSQKVVPTASVIKIPILFSLLKAQDNKLLKLTDFHLLKKQEIVAGSGDLQFEPENTKMDYLFLAKKMISISDNTATNILIDKLKMENIQNDINAFGLKNTYLKRKMMDFEAIKAGKQNITTAQDINTLLLKLLTKKLLSRKAGKQALEILIGCEDTVTIPRFLPKKIVIAHKSGTLDYLRGDAGIIFSKKTLVLTVFVENFESQEQAETIIGKVAELSYLNFGK